MVIVPAFGPAENPTFSTESAKSRHPTDIKTQSVHLNFLSQNAKKLSCRANSIAPKIPTIGAPLFNQPRALPIADAPIAHR